MVAELPPIDDPLHWRMRAEELRMIADDVRNPASRRILLNIAADYEHLALRTEQRLTRPPCLRGMAPR